MTILSKTLCFRTRSFYAEQLQFLAKIIMDSRPFSPTGSSPDSPLQESQMVCNGDAAVSLQEWQNWGATSSVPAMVTEVIEDLKLLEKDMNAHMDFGGHHGTLKGDFKMQEDKKHRAKFQSLGDSEKKLQFFSARQIACRLLGSSGYLCQKCWLPKGDCMCSRIMPCPLWHRIRFWLYMHPKDFLRQNNTGKLLCQVFGNQAATLCLFGISELEEIMWNSFKFAGRRNVWCLYPNKNAVPKSVHEAFIKDSSSCDSGKELAQVNGDERMNFILIDGTWSNSQAMFNRLQDRAQVVWGEDLSCISLNSGSSSMHKLRPQPSWDRTCTAGAAIGLLYELELIPEFSSHELHNQAEAIEDALEILLEALTARRIRMGRSIRRKERYNGSFC